MPRYAAFLRGVSPMNAKMPELKAAFEAVGFTDVKTVLSSGNVVFSARVASVASLQRKAEAAMGAILSVYLPNPKGPVFMTLIEKTFGKEVTTRTWETVAKAAK